MAIQLVLMGQNDPQYPPDVTLTGDPGTDSTTLTNAGYLGGVIVALKTSATAGRGTVAVPCDAATEIPFGTLLVQAANEFSGSIGVSGSQRVTVVRALWQGLVDSQGFVATPVAPYTIGGFLYCGTGANKGLYTSDKPANGSVGINPVGICNALPTGTYPMLGVASLL